MVKNGFPSQHFRCACSVLLTECGTAKLTDLGLARCCAAAAATEAGKDNASLVGTFAW